MALNKSYNTLKMRTPFICYVVILLLSLSCTENNKVESEDFTVTSEPYSDAPQIQADTPALTQAQHDSIVVSEFVSESHLYGNKNYSEMKTLKKYIPSGYMLCDYLHHDLNEDGLIDYLMVFSTKESPNEGELMHLYLMQQDNTLKLQAVNKSLHTYWNVKADSTGSGFSVTTRFSTMGRYGTTTSSTSHFVYDSIKKDWFFDFYCFFTESVGEEDLLDENGSPVLDEEGNYVLDTTKQGVEPIIVLDNGEECTTFKTQKELGIVSFSKFSFSEMLDKSISE